MCQLLIVQGILKDIYNQSRENVYNDADEYLNLQIPFRFMKSIMKMSKLEL